MPTRTNDGIKKRCGCPRRRWPKCSHPWHFSFHHGGREHRVSLDVVARARNLRPPVSKGEAESWRDTLRSEIRAGTFVEPTTAPPVAAPADTRLTAGDVFDRYLREHVERPNRRAGATATMRYHVGILRRTAIPAAHGTTIALGDKPIADVTADDVEAVREARRAYYREQAEKVTEARHRAETQRQARAEAQQQAIAAGVNLPRDNEPLIGVRLRAGVKAGEVGINRLLARLRHVCTWALTRRPPILDRHPFKQHGETVVHLANRVDHLAVKVEAHRRRRLASGEEAALLTKAGVHLHALIIAALETGCRVGELLSLQWHDVLFADVEGRPTMRSFQLSAAKTKTSTDRTVPITSRLRAVLAMRRHGPDGKEVGPDAYVFGNDVGEPIASIKTAWRATCRRAGIDDLHFHDLRREFASRLLESGATLAEVQACLGHANITMTSRYLGTTDAGLQRAFRLFEKASAIRTPFAQTAESVDSAPATAPTENASNILIQ